MGDRVFVACRKGMAGLIAGACAFAMGLGLTGCSLTTPTRAEVEAKPVEATLGADDLVEDGVLTVAMDMTDAPQAMTDHEGKPSGYYADIARLLAERLGLDLEVVSSADATGSLSKGKADLYIGARSNEDGEGVDVSEALVQNASSIFAKTADGSREVPTVSATSLQGAVIAVQGDSAAQDALSSAGIEATLKTQSNVNECFEALAAGEADYVACDATAGAYLSRAYPGAVFVGTVAPTLSYSAIVTSDTELGSQAMEILDEALSDGTLAALFRMWYGDLPFSFDDCALEGVDFEDEPAEESADAADAAEGVSDGLNSLG